MFLAVVAAIALWWLSRQRLAALPWLETGIGAEFPDTQASRLPSAKIGLGFFLVVAGCLFALLSSAYVMHADSAAAHRAMGAGLLPPPLLWVNSAALVAGSLCMQCASVAARRGQRDWMVGTLAAGGLAALAFVVGQVLAWFILVRSGHPFGSGPDNDYFYLLTGIHGVHVLGGLVILGVMFAEVLRGAAIERVSLTVELCAYYWHFLLLVWVILFGLLLGGADAIGGFCRALVS